MSGKEEMRIFVGGLSWDTTERHLEDAFSRFGKVLEAQVMLERDTGRPRGFGFVTFADQRAMDRSINEMHGQELAGRVISVNKAQPKVGSDDPGYGYGGGGYSSGGRGGYRSSDGPPPGRSDCFKCGRPGHFARECPSAGGGGGGGSGGGSSGGGRFSSRPRFGGSGGGRGDRYGGGDRYGDRYVDDRYDGGRYGDRYGDRDRVESRDSRYGSGRGDRYGSDRYPPAGDRYSGDRYGGGPDRYPQNGYGKERSYDRDGGPRGGGGGGGGGSDRYGSGGPARYESSYRERPGPYDRPSRGGGRPSSYEDRYP